MKRKERLKSLSGPALLLAIAAAFGLMSLQHAVGSRLQPGPGAFPMLLALALAVFAILGMRKSSASAIRYAIGTSSQSSSGHAADGTPSLPLMPVVALLLFVVMISVFSLAVAVSLTALAAVSPFHDVSRMTRLLTAVGTASVILLGYHSDEFISLLVSSLTS